MSKGFFGTLAVCGAVAILIAGCAGDGSRDGLGGPDREQKTQQQVIAEADQLYRLARKRLDAADFGAAILQYGILKARFPFSSYASHSQAEMVYALYRNFQHEQAVTEADRFIREYPRHVLIPYVHYIRGLVFFERGKGFLDSLPTVDASRRDVTDARRAFDEFSLLSQRYPNSDYVADARDRMIYLRNRIAEHEMHVVRYYVERGAYVAAIRRAQSIIAENPGAPATFEALLLSEQSYRRLGMTEQAAEMRRLIDANKAPVAAAMKNQLPDVSPVRWWKPWTWFSAAAETPAPPIYSS